MEITAALVKELRQRTGLGMMECKKALLETRGDIEAAVEVMRKSGLAQAGKKAGRIAAEGMIVIALAPGAKQAVMVEVNCETNFVAKGDAFKRFAQDVAQVALKQQPGDVDALLALPLGEGSVNSVRQALIAKIGENIGVRRFVRLESKGLIGAYSHGARIGVLVDGEGADAELAKRIAMHIAANKPMAVAPQDVPAEVIAKEREIYSAQAAESGKPAAILEKMIEGKVKKFLAESTLLSQPYLHDAEKTVEQVLKEVHAKVLRFERFEVGEGVVRKTENFAEEVMAQVSKGLRKA
ncbi:MAG: translation elongation factor Ts [Gammaproteobacteria bacterium]